MPAFGALLKLAKPAKVPSFGARSGGEGSFASAGVCKASVIPVDGSAASSPPEASLMRSGAVSAAPSRSMFHLNLSQPLGSCRPCRCSSEQHQRNQERRAHCQSTAIITSEALITTVTWPLALMPRSSTASLVIEDVTTWPPPISTRTCEVVAPFLTSMTVPLIWLRALMRMAVLTMLGRAQLRHAPDERW